MNLLDRIQHGWNAFMGRDPTPHYNYPTAYGTNHVVLSRGNERTYINGIINRISMDVAALTVEHARLDEFGRYAESIDSKLNECLTMAANADQTGRMFIQDAALSLLDEGVIGIVPTTATSDPRFNATYDIGSLRVGKVVEWYPQHVKLNLYNEFTGQKEDRIFPKSMVALPENPFYAVMNEPNSIYQRLLTKLRQLDVIDNYSSSDKFNLIIQVPYSTSSGRQMEKAEERRRKIEMQLSDSKYGIAYIDGTEKVIQLNRAVESNLFAQVEYYTNMLHAQLGMPPSVFDGTADEQVLLNYQSRTVEPIISAIVDNMKWKFLTPNARTRGQSVVFFSNPFKMTPASKIAEIADKFTRNAILSANEVRQIIGYKPSDDPAADELKNANLKMQDQQVGQENVTNETDDTPEENSA